MKFLQTIVPEHSHNQTKAAVKLALGFLLAAPICSTQAQGTEPEVFEEVLIVGSRIAGRSADDLPVPVDTINEDALKDTGQVELGRMLQLSAPSFNFSSSSISDGTDALRPATLRGLGPDQTLVLINGKRRHQASLIHINTSVGRGTAGTDMNAIPAAGIQRVDILRDGAAAQYGSDAIAGIINLVLKDADSGGSADVSYGEYSEGDGETVSINLNKGMSLGNAGFLNVTTSYRDRGNTNRADPQGGCLYGSCVDTDNNGYLEPAAGNEDIEVNGPGRNGFRIGDAESNQFSFLLNTGLEIGEGELYGFITYSRRENESGAFYRNPTGTSAALTDGFNPVDPDGFLPIIYSEIDDLSFDFGYRQDFSNDATLDVSYTTGTNTIDYSTKNSGNYSYANYLQYQQGYSDSTIRSIMPREAYAYGLELSLTTINLDYSQFLGDFSYALGTEIRTDVYKVFAGEEYSYRDYDTDPATGNDLFPQNAPGSIQGFNGLVPDSEVEEERDVFSIYLDTEYQATDRWFMSAALRYDEYEGFGDTVNFKFANSFALSDDYTVRGAVSSGFRAPSMQQLYFNNISTQIRGTGAVTVGTFRNDSTVAKALGIPELKEEESLNYSLGLVANFTSQWNLTVDFYGIKIEDRVVISNQLTAANDPGNGALIAALESSGAGAAQFFLNGVSTRTSGVDMVSTYYGIDLGAGTLDLTLAANYNVTEVIDTYVPPAGALSAVNPSVVFSDQDISIIEEWQPKDRVILSAKYMLDKLTVNLALNRFGEYTTLDDGGKQTYSAEVLTDFRLGYVFNDTLDVYLAANNIFDVTPDEATNTTSRGGQFESTPGAEDMASDTVFRYSRRSAPFGFNGAFISAGVVMKF